MPEKFEVGDIVVCMDDSPWAGICDMDVLEKDKAYEVLYASMARDIVVRESARAWKGERFRRATLSEIRKYRKEQGYEKHRFAIGDIVVAIAVGGTVNLGRVCTVSAVHVDDAGECFVDLDGSRVVGMYYAANFRKATPAEAEAYRKANEKATASLVAGTTIVPGQLVTVSISDKPPFTAVDVTPIQEKPKDTLDASVSARPSGVAWATKAELAPTFNVTFTWDGPEKMPLTGNDAPEAINKAIAVPNPQMLTSADGREFDIIDWKPTVSTGEVVKVEANMVVKQAKDKPKSLTDGLVGAWAPKPAASAWVPKPGDLVVCKDTGHSSGVLETGKVYEVSGKIAKCDEGGQKIVLQGTSLGVGRESGWYTNRFRPATPEEICDYHKEKGFPDHQFKTGDIVVAVDVRMADGTRLAPNFAVGSVHEVVYRSGIGIRVSGCDLQGFWNATRFRKATHEEKLRFLRDKKRQKGPDFGYRFLDKDEIVDEGDEYWAADVRTWILAMKVGLPASTLDLYRRRNKFAEGELVQIIKPATEQERGRWPHWTDTLSMNRLDGKVFPMPKTRTHTHGRDSIYTEGWELATDWLAPATKAQKEAYEAKENAKKAKIQELEARMKDIQSELSSLKGT